MPENNAVSITANSSLENLQEAMWMMEIQDGGGDGQHNPYPDRPGEPDCIYYLRTGSCGYGSNCRYNHPAFPAQGAGQFRGELPERVGQPDCQYFLKTGACKFGATCKYHHPPDKHDVQPVPLNILGLPLRQDEKSCPYYMRTGSCKFGFVCKFNHPQPATLGAAFPITGSTGSSVPSPSGVPLMGRFSPWSLSRPPYPSNPRTPGLPAYMPFVFSPSQGTIPMQQGWSTYTGTMSRVPSTELLAYHVNQGTMSRVPSTELLAYHVNQGTMSRVPSTELLATTQISNSLHLAQLGSSVMVNLPERPDQPECHYFMKTGNCKYGTTCKYHHPKERNYDAMSTLGPLGLPIRPGQAVCTFYSTYGTCKYGSACKFDHPMVGYYNYSLPSLSTTDRSAYFPNQRSSEALWTPAEASTSRTRAPVRIMKSEMSNGLRDKEKGDPAQDAAAAPVSPPEHSE